MPVCKDADEKHTLRGVYDKGDDEMRLRCKLCNVELDESNFLDHIEEKHPDIFMKLDQLDVAQRDLANQESILIKSIMEIKK